MKLSVPLFPYDRWGSPSEIVRGVQHAEELGFAAVALPEHIVMPVRPGSDPVSAVWYDAFVLATHVAAKTSTIRLQLHALVVPYRHPLLTAKLVASLDVMSEGRVTVVAGAGWMRREFAMLDVPFDERGARTDEYLAAIKALWTQDHPTFAGKFVSFQDLAFEPRCVQRPHVPLWIGGSGPRPLRRAVEIGDGWAPLGGDPADLVRSIDWLRNELDRHGRASGDFAFAADLPILGEEKAVARAKAPTIGDDERSLTTPGAVTDAIARHAEAGFTQLNVLFPWRTPAEYRDRLDWLAAEVMPAIRDL
ncbi:MAG: class F420-dependent oxidoreductase [Actinomycetia bacterium]|nr:class F420-dependent oxidoreductase [Actinomycetes bacterium]